MPERRPSFAPLEILGRRIDGVVSWNVNDTCNYRCSYCTQRHKEDRSYRLAAIASYLEAFARLPGNWEIKLSGGEPFQQPHLEQIVAGLVARGHVVSVQTNFSASEERLVRFLEATKGALHLFSASLHLEYDTPERFLERSTIVRRYERFGVQFHVTSVATPERLRHLHDVVAPFFARAGIRFKVQPEKIEGAVRPYDEAERALLLALGGHNLTGEVAPNFRGRLCFAGSRYLVIKSNGRAFRCYPASRHGGRHAELGSFVGGIELLDGAHPCPYTYCNCTVPIHRGMVVGVSRPLPMHSPTE